MAGPQPTWWGQSSVGGGTEPFLSSGGAHRPDARPLLPTPPPACGGKSQVPPLTHATSLHLLIPLPPGQATGTTQHSTECFSPAIALISNLRKLRHRDNKKETCPRLHSTAVSEDNSDAGCRAAQPLLVTRMPRKGGDLLHKERGGTPGTQRWAADLGQCRAEASRAVSPQAASHPVWASPHSLSAVDLVAHSPKTVQSLRPARAHQPPPVSVPASSSSLVLRDYEIVTHTPTPTLHQSPLLCSRVRIQQVPTLSPSCIICLTLSPRSSHQ